MAISKILHMKDSGNSFHARHLKRALDYVMNPEKTQGGRLVGAINCQADMAFEQMMDTKKQAILRLPVYRQESGRMEAGWM